MRKAGNMQSIRPLCALAIGASLAALMTGCGKEEVMYEPRELPSAVKANLPAPPSIPDRPLKAGEAYTVWGAAYNLRSRVHREEIDGKDIKLTGYITRTNLDKAPKCAVHETGKEDPEGCNAPVPTFWIADTKDAPESEQIRVMGWASNFAQLYDAIKEYKKLERTDKTPDEPLADNFWGVPIPFPLPNAGAKVTVKGNYSNNFTKATRGAEADPIMGILTYESIEYMEKPEEPARLPGMRL